MPRKNRSLESHAEKAARRKRNDERKMQPTHQIKYMDEHGELHEIVKKLKVGQKFKNMIDLFDYLGIYYPDRTNSCLAVIKRLKCYISYESVLKSQNIIIKEIYDEPKERIDGRSSNSMNGAKRVAKIDIETGTVLDIYPSIREASRTNGYPEDNIIGAVCNGSYKTYKGFYWRFVNKDGEIEEVTTNPKENFTEPNDFSGVYLIHNTDKDKYYVGQSIHVKMRVKQHFIGLGCAGVYNDYKQGDHFETTLLDLKISGYDNLDDFERDMIAQYDAYNNGYNKTKGNTVKEVQVI